MEAKALSLAESATTSVLGKLGSILAQEAGLLAGVEDDIQYIMDELESMASFLRVLSSRQDHDDQVKTWIKQVREMAYDAEDFIDVFKHRIGKPREEHGCIGFLTHTCRLLRTLRARHVLAIDLQKLKLRARDVSERRARYCLTTGTTSGGASQSSSAAAISSEPRLSALLVEEPVGIDERRDMLIGWLTEENQPQLRVISLVGFGGLGKTTLANMVYQSPDVTSGHFQARAWISVSQTFEIKVLLQQMILQFSFGDQEMGYHDENMERVKLQRSLEKMGMAELVTTAIDYLQDKRYVIVLDDMWTINAWDRFRVALPDNKKGSRIIVTTRNKTVANTCCSNNHELIYEIPPLPKVESWELFCKRVFDGPCPDELKDLSKAILKKCGGLPLAIIAIAGLLAAKPKKTREEWQRLHNHLGSELEANPSLEGMKHVLTLSYNDLPYHLKPCFLYLSIFPEDYEIGRKRLMRRWVAEGLASGRRGMSAEEVAEGYFNELINRSLIQPSKIGDDGKVKTCSVHDIMLELIVSISMEENFVTVLGEEDYSTSSSIQAAAAAHGKIRRLSLHHQSSTPKDDVYLSQVRSLTTFGERGPLQDYGKVRLLRVLDLEGCRSLRDNHLNNISKLFLLNFLSLRSTGVLELPDSIGDLRNLQFLDIRGTDIGKLPSAVVKLQRLAYLLGGWGRARRMTLPKGVGKMKALRELGLIDGTYSRGLQEIGELTQLKKLDIEFKGVDDTCLTKLFDYFSTEVGKPVIDCLIPQNNIGRQRKHLLTSLDKLNSCLRSLTLFDWTEKVIDVLQHLSKPPVLLQEINLYGPMDTLPVWFASLNQITYVVLRNTCLKQDALQVLKDLPALVQLTLAAASFIGCLRIECEGFERLKLLKICFMRVSFEERALSNLESLKLVGNVDDLSITGMEHLLKLKEVSLYYPDESLREMLKKTVEAHPNHPKFIVG